MAIPASLARNLRLPLIVAPMFLVSGPELVIAARRAGIIGTFPALNQRTTEGYRDWLDQIAAAEGPEDAAYGVNLIIHNSNGRLVPDLALTVERKVPLVITSIGIQAELVDAVHGYGGLVFHDVISARHAERAIAAGVDGLIVLCAGAGGHSGTLNPFALMAEIRAMFDGTILLAGALSTGRDIAAARVMGADLAYMGTRFIATQECAADAGYKRMIVESAAVDVTLTRAVSGLSANFLASSLKAGEVDPATVGPFMGEAKPWKDLWSAGQGVGAIHDIPSVAELTEALGRDYDAAIAEAAGLARSTDGLTAAGLA